MCAFPRMMDCGLLGFWCHYSRLFEFTCNYLYSLNRDNKMLQEENYPTIHPSLSLSSIHQQINLPTSRLLRGSKTSPGIPVALFVEWYFISQKCLLPLGIFFLLRNKCFFIIYESVVVCVLFHKKKLHVHSRRAKACKRRFCRKGDGNLADFHSLTGSVKR